MKLGRNRVARGCAKMPHAKHPCREAATGPTWEAGAVDRRLKGSQE